MRRFLNTGIPTAIAGALRALPGLGKFTTLGRGDGPSDTLRLYRMQDDVREFVWVYEAAGHIHVDVGAVGVMAERGVYPAEAHEAIAEHVAGLRAAGFAEVPEQAMDALQITYATEDSLANGGELDKRNALLDEADAFFALTGQGYWIDASTGMGTMELVFSVVDIDIARQSLEHRLRDTRFGDYLAIGTPDEPGFGSTPEGFPVPA